MAAGTASPKECSGELALKTGVAEKAGRPRAPERLEETRMQGDCLFSLSLPPPAHFFSE